MYVFRRMYEAGGIFVLVLSSVDVICKLIVKLDKLIHHLLQLKCRVKHLPDEMSCHTHNQNV